MTGGALGNCGWLWVTRRGKSGGREYKDIIPPIFSPLGIIKGTAKCINHVHMHYVKGKYRVLSVWGRTRRIEMGTFVKEEGEDMISPTSPPPPTPPCLLPLKTPHHFLSILPSICGIQTMEWNAAPRLKYKSRNNLTDFLQKQNFANIDCLAECWCNVKQCKGKVIRSSFFVFSSKCLMPSCNEVAKQEAGSSLYCPPGNTNQLLC